MTAAVVLVFVARNAVVKKDLAREATSGQELERAINGRGSDARIFLFHQTVELLDREMLAGFEEGTQDGVPLFGLFQADLAEVPQEDALGFAHTFPRDCGLIVNALLKHVLACPDPGIEPQQGCLMILAEWPLRQSGRSSGCQ
jgi:hypothetical protein